MLSDESILQQLYALGKDGVIKEFTLLSQSKIKDFKTKNIEGTNEFSDLLFQEAYKFMKISERDIGKLKDLLDKSNIQINKKLKSQLNEIIPKEKIDTFDKEILQLFTGSLGLLKSKQLISFTENQKLLIDALIDLDVIHPIRESKTISLDALRSFIVFKILENSEAFPEDLKEGWYEFYYLDFVTKRLLFDMSVETDIIPLRNILNSRVFVDLLTIGRTGTENCLSYDNVTTTRIQFEEICNAQKGMHVEKKDMKNIYGFNFTSSFLNRLYQYIETVDELATFNGFTSFYLAIRYVKHPMAARFFFRIFDTDKNGKVDLEDIKYFFEGHQNEIHANVTLSDFIQELNKMIDKTIPFTEKEMIGFEKRDELIYLLIDTVTYCETFRIGGDEDEDENEMSL